MLRCRWVLVCWVLVVGAVPAAAGAEEGEAGETPSLEYRPPRPVVPEPKGPTPMAPVAIFEDAIGGFGLTGGSFDGPVDVAFVAFTEDLKGGPVRRNTRYLAVLDRGNDRLQLFDGSGSFVAAFGSSGTQRGEFRDPVAVVSGFGYLVVVDSGNSRLQFFSLDRDFFDARRSAEYGRFGSKYGEFNNARDAAFCPDGTLWVLDAGNERVQVIAESGDGVLDVNGVGRVSAQGMARNEWGNGFGYLGGSFEDLVSIACTDDPIAPIFLLSANCLVQQFERNGRLVASWTANAPESGLCVGGRIEADNRDDVLYVLDAGNSLLMRFTRTGKYLAGKRGAEEAFREPRGLAIDEARQDFAVADTGNDLVQTFTLR